MNTVRSLLAKKKDAVYSTYPGAPVFDALQCMAQNDIGALVVLEGERLVGIFSERDYARKVILLGKASKTLSVGEIMTPQVVTVGRQQTVAQCMALMSRHHIRHLPVLDEGKVVGVISMRDVVEALLTEQEATIETLERAVLGKETLE